MALRRIVQVGDPILRKKSREVTAFNDRLRILLDDLKETLRENNGVGLAAVQVGALRRAFVVNRDGEMLELVNPEIVHTEGEQEKIEGCLSIPGVYGITKRPMTVTIRAKDGWGKPVEYTESGVVAQAFCHESDHLNGVLFIDHVVRMLKPEELEEHQSGKGEKVQKGK